jgi:hypothetical protein
MARIIAADQNHQTVHHMVFGIFLALRTVTVTEEATSNPRRRQTIGSWQERH